jgi:ribosomal protein S18 acetylase RimI-like enzyme
MNKIIAIMLVALINHAAIAKSWSELAQETSGDEVSLIACKYADLDEGVFETLQDRLEECHFLAFKKAYEAHWSPEREAALNKNIHIFFDDFKNSDQYVLVVAQKRDLILGWMLFKEETYGVYLELLCLDPIYWGQGIGKKLVLSIMDYAPHSTTISLLTRKINAVAPSFYEHLGFKKTDFMLPNYSSQDYQGYEITLT